MVSSSRISRARMEGFAGYGAGLTRGSVRGSPLRRYARRRQAVKPRRPQVYFRPLFFGRSRSVLHVRQYLRQAVHRHHCRRKPRACAGGHRRWLPTRLELSLDDLQRDLDRRKPGTSRHTTQRREADEVEILSGVFEGRTTGCPIGLLIRNTDQKSKDYSAIKDLFRPAHADYTYHHKYGLRDYRGGGRSSARETAMRVAAGAIAKKYRRRWAFRCAAT